MLKCHLNKVAEQQQQQQQSNFIEITFLHECSPKVNRNKYCTKNAVSSGFWLYLLKKSLIENFAFYVVKVAKQLYWSHTLARVFSYAAYFQNTSGRLLLEWFSYIHNFFKNRPLWKQNNCPIFQKNPRNVSTLKKIPKTSYNSWKQIRYLLCH